MNANCETEYRTANCEECGVEIDTDYKYCASCELWLLGTQSGEFVNVEVS